jgi:hypothetical protein
MIGAPERVEGGTVPTPATWISVAYGHRCGNLPLSSTPQNLFAASAMSSDPTAGMY